MRSRLGALAFSAAALAVMVASSEGCKWAGVSAVYMAIDQGGMQERTEFFTDSLAIYCIAKFSSARQDVTVSFTIHEVPGPVTTSAQMNSGLADPANPLHPVFAVDQETPGPGTEEVVAFNVPPQGVMVPVMCSGYCVQNGVGCMSGYQEEQIDSCGVGATCCFNALAMGMAPTLVLPYPRGNYTCEVDVNSEVAGVAPFTIDFPPSDGGMECPLPPPVNGEVCAGWVMQGSRCPGFSADETCICDGAGWKCTTNP
jgi:hypothetical protein